MRWLLLFSALALVVFELPIEVTAAGGAGTIVPGGAGPMNVAGGAGNGLGIRAARVADLRNSEGINVNLSWDNGGRDDSPPYQDPYSERASCAWAKRKLDCGGDAVAYMLGYLGIRHVRDGVVGHEDRLQDISRLAPGVTWDMVAVIPGYQSSRTSLDEYIGSASRVAGNIEAIEGTNEPDNAAFTMSAAYGGSTDRAEQTKAWQRDLWKAAKDNLRTAAIPIFGPSLTPFCTGMRSLSRPRALLRFGCYESFFNLSMQILQTRTITCRATTSPIQEMGLRSLPKTLRRRRKFINRRGRW
jgi:hypothetical protein